jgi:carbamoyltransferase
MYILGISAYYHDSAACLVKDGRIVAAAQEERFTHRKHDQDFPDQAVEFCLRHAGITGAELDHVVFYDKPLLKFVRLLETYFDYAPQGLSSFMKAMPVWMREKLWIREQIAERTNYKGKVLFTEHHESHAASAFFPSPFESAAVLTMDGVGEWATSSFGYGRGNELHLLKELHFPHSLGLLYSAFTYYTGFKVNSGEYKVMGLAPYGEPRYVRQILDEIVDLRDDGSLRLNMNYFNFAAGLTMISREFDRLFGGPPRTPEGELTQREMNLARSIQEVCEEAMLRMARHAHRETGERNLCLAGGVALNCVGNGRILREGPFEKVWIQPAAGDAGGSLGAALSVWYQYLNNKRDVREVCKGHSDEMQGAYLGPAFTSAEVRNFLETTGANYRRLGRADLTGHVARLLAEEKVVGWFQGRMEFGPRALGARSILGDPRSPNMQTQMNLKIKFRESFRPFAPSVLRERVSDFFEMDTDSPYMLLVAPVRKELCYEPSGGPEELPGIEKLNARRSTIPAVTHVDLSARVQTVRREANPHYYDLIVAFERLTGCPMLVNTSLNVRGEPIACTPEQAYNCFMRTDMDCLVMEDYIIEKKEQGEGLLSADPAWQEGSVLTGRAKPSKVTDAESRKSVLMVACALFVIAAWSLYRGRTPAVIVFGTLAGALALIGMMRPALARRFHLLWMTLAGALGHVNSRIMLLLVFYLIFVPYHLIMRAVGRDPLNRRKAGRHSYWIKRETTREAKGQFERLF